MNESEERNIELLLRQLKDSDNIDLRSSAAEKLGFKKAHIDKIIPALIEALNDDNWLVRTESAKALAQIGRAALIALDALRDSMNEPRNKSKRAVFYEVIKTLETIESTEPEITPSDVIEEKVDFIEETVEEKIEPVIEEIISEETTFEEVSTEQVEVPTEEITEEEKEEIEEYVEEYLEEAIEDALEDSIEEVTEESVDEEKIEDIADEIAEELSEDIAEQITEEIFEEEKVDESIAEIEKIEPEDQLETEIKSLEEKIEEHITDTEELLKKKEEVFEDAAEDVVEEKHEQPIEETKEEITLDKMLVFDEEEAEKKKINDRLLVLPSDQEETLSEDIPTRKMSSSLVKVILVGDKGVGKTTLRKEYCDIGFKSEHKEVIGADFATKHYTLDEKNFALQVWDIAAKDRFEQNKVVYYRGTNGAMLVFDITQRSSYDNILNWFANIREIESGKIAYVLVGNKADLRASSNECVSFEEGEELATKLSLLCGTNVLYVETCATTGEAVSDAFQTLENKAANVFLEE